VEESSRGEKNKSTGETKPTLTPERGGHWPVDQTPKKTSQLADGTVSRALNYGNLPKPGTADRFGQAVNYRPVNQSAKESKK
jgi:hypothetical protein